MKTTLKSHLGALLLLLLSIAAFAVGQPSVHSQANWPCDEVVVDQAGVLGAEIADVRAAAERLIAQGATVRVFVVPTTGINNLDLYVDDIEETCPSWQASDGDRKNNLIVLGVSVEERSTGLYYGSIWIDLLDPEQIRIQSEVINPHFRDGDFAVGLVAGLDEIARLIEVQRHPTAVPQATAAPAATSGESGQGGLIALGIVGGIVVLGGAAAGGLLFYRTHVARRRAQQRAREIKMKVADRLLRLPEEIAFAEMELGNLKDRVVQEEYHDLPKKLNEARRLISQVNADFQNVQMAGSDPDQKGLAREEYEGFAASFQELLGLLDQASQAVSEVRSEIQTLRELPAKIPEAAEQVQQALEATREQVAERTQEFANRQAEQLMEQAQDHVDEAREVGKKKRPRQAMRLLDEAQLLLEQAVATTSLLPSLRGRITEVDGIVDEGAAVFQQMAAQHAESAWHAVRGNGTEAENRLEWAQEALEEAAADLTSDEAEHWAAVPERVQQAQAWLDEAVALVQSIREHRQHLEEARQAAPPAVQQVKEDIASARRYILQYDRDIREQLEHELDAAELDWEQVNGELSGERPDYLDILQRVKGVQQVTERILAEARSEHETIERLVQYYAAELRVVQGALSSVDNYIRNHAGDVGRDVGVLTEQAEQSLRAAQVHRAQADRLEDTARRKTLEEAVQLVQEAGEEAERAYARARQEVAHAEEARRPRVVPIPLVIPGSSGGTGGWGTPRPAPPTPRPAPTPRSRPSPSRRSSGGSSTSWGRSSSGRSSGGSSTGWGSSRRRGGGSTGW